MNNDNKRNALLNYLLLALVLCVGFSNADEGMWMPQQLNKLAPVLEKLGIDIPTDRFSDLLGYPMNAVISMGYCSGAFVSAQGLIITNHHCAFDSIQYNSTSEHNYIEKGFLARSLAEELPAAKGLQIYVTIDFQDVTAQILKGITADIAPKKRYELIESRSKALVKQGEKEPGVRCQVASYFAGVQYLFIKQKVIKDVRLVYAPPQGVGTYGGDIDNFMWPRHTGDYAFFRAYVGKDGSSKEYSQSNVPYRPAHFLKVNPHGIKPGEPVLAVGYPGRTYRYLTSYEVKVHIDWLYPFMVKMLGDYLQILENIGKQNPQIAIKVAARKEMLANTLKYCQGMVDGLKNSPLVSDKQKREANLARRLASQPQLLQQAQKALTTIETLVESNNQRQRNAILRWLVRGSDLLAFALHAYQLSEEKNKPDAQRKPGFQVRDIPLLKKRTERKQQSLDLKVDRAVLHYFLQRAIALPKEQQLLPLQKLIAHYNGIPGLLDYLYQQTKLDKLKVRLQMIKQNYRQLTASQEPFMVLARTLYPWRQEYQKREQEIKGKLALLRPDYVKAFLASETAVMYPDANGTLRVTYGRVIGYSPHDAVVYLPQTTFSGVRAKNTGKSPFNTPAAVLAQAKTSGFGPYQAKNLGDLPICFLSNCDSTGGNSGSPTLDSKGQLVGLLFDGNYESMPADYQYNPAFTRSIHVDIRYILWLMDFVDKAHRLIKEMGLSPCQASSASDAKIKR